MKSIDLRRRIHAIAGFVLTFIKWLVIAGATGVITGLIGSFFNITISRVTEFRKAHDYIIYLLPVAGVVIVGMYRLCKVDPQTGTNLIISSVRSHEKIPALLVPLIFISAAFTHLFGGSAGREGAALQIGGTIGFEIGRVLKLEQRDMSIMLICGMAGLFSALFGTPLAASFSAMEVISVGVIYYAGLIPSLVSSLTAYGIALLFKISPERFEVEKIPGFSAHVLLKVVLLAAFTAVVSIVFCLMMEYGAIYMKKFIKNDYLKAFAGGLAVVALTVISGTTDYNGAGMDIVEKAVTEGQARPEAFALKMIFTCITISAGFKGGEIVPTFFIGATFGCAMGSILGLPAGFGAALGLAAMFCGCVNCPAASIILSVELFGAEGMIYFAVACAVSYMLSGYYGLYSSQKIVYSKLKTEFININAK